jgi:hypothetical protein
MKVRAGFVSNSSSTAFILDLRDDKVRESVEGCGAGHPEGLNRCTALATGSNVVHYAQDWIAEMEAWGSDVGPNSLGRWIMEWANKLGHDNIVFARESDEGMGGWLNFDAYSLALDEMDYH